jgi:CRP/FNR family cyclic AMP-dependent transcriptional regulator
VTAKSVVLFFGFFASALVFATFFMRSPMRLRQVGILSNVVFISYGIIGHIVPVLVLHALLLPLNLRRLWQIGQSRVRLRTALNGDVRQEWFESCTEVALHAGEQLFAKGDLGTTMYFLTTGNLILRELDVTLGPGSVVGEIAMLSSDGVRTATVAAIGEARLLSISKEQLLSLYHRHPAFGLYLFRIVTNRLIENHRRAVANGDPSES